jgi:Recombination directionality factor-like
MSPVPIIELQRRLTLVGAIRAGGEKPERGPGRKLESFRLTSPRQPLILQAAELYGGPVSPWRSPIGKEWQVYTEAEEIPVLVMPGYSLRQAYELWEGATKRTRLCDGLEEELTGGPCLCNAEGEDRCDLYTRLVVALPELDTVLGWRLISRGANAGHELPTMMALVEARAGGSPFVPARLRLDERRGVVNEQVVRYVVPTLDFGIGYAALAGAQNGPRALPPGSDPGVRGEPPVASGAVSDASGAFIPAKRHDPSVREALEAISKPGEPRSTRTAPLAPHHPAAKERPPLPTPTGDETVSPLPAGEQAVVDQGKQEFAATEVPPRMITDAQRRKLHASFRDKGILDRDERLGYCSKVLDRIVATSTAMTLDEASTVIEHIDQYDPDNPQTWPFPEGF